MADAASPMARTLQTPPVVATSRSASDFPTEPITKSPVCGRPTNGTEKCKEMSSEINGRTLADVAKAGQSYGSQTTGWMTRKKKMDGLELRGSGARPAVSKAGVGTVKTLPEVRCSSEESSCRVQAARVPKSINVRCVQSEVNTRLQTAIVDHWFGCDLRGETEVLKYIKGAVKSIKIGVESLTNQEFGRELAAAVGRRVAVMLVIDVKKSYNSGLESIKTLIEAGVQVCHCTEGLDWNTAIFDSQILVQGSRSWSDSSVQGFNVECAMVFTGPIGKCRSDGVFGYGGPDSPI
ncbi:unnamed protein product [Phytophthora fragariaefolia]|uniref:Unnamed protein product n=1 Tax=Phytophthora fragariaefolia TaxID=1490495 RepID=A0A9W6XZ53_9STRA|nr:unnamed protein product [Phytophthora fragariaefolia]